MARLLMSCFFLLSCLAACARHRQANSNCECPNETGAGPPNLSHTSQGQHLSDGAEFAEDLAIRYADVHWGLHTSQFEGIAEYERADFLIEEYEADRGTSFGVFPNGFKACGMKGKKIF